MKKYPFLSLRTRLIVAFLSVALIPLVALAYINYKDTESLLIKNANQALYAAASQTANRVDAFIRVNLNSVRVESVLPIFIQYLRAIQLQTENPYKAEALATLTSLSRRDTLNIYSYALLDIKGKNLLDINSHNIGQDESKEDYFIQAFQTNLTYVSPIHFLPDKSNIPVIYFSSPVRNAQNQVIGVLRYCYVATVIQQLITSQTGVAGDRSFPILLDENYIPLAYGNKPYLVFKPIVPLSEVHLQQLYQQRRLPPKSQLSMTWKSQALKRSLDRASQHPFATVSLEATQNQPTVIAIAPVSYQPWYVIFAQPEATLLAPIEKQIRSFLIFASFIVIIVTVSAVVIVQLLARPLRYLTRKVSQFDPDQLEMRINLQSHDEVGMLVQSFNRMIERMSSYAKALAETNHILEQKVAERTAELKYANQELSRMVTLDPLTQISNRRHFNDYLVFAWQRHLREQKPLALIFIDIDYFKRYNDFYGHQGGDECLIRVAQAFNSCLRSQADLVARYGGEEFLVILSNANTGEALKVANSIQKAIATLAIPHQYSEVSSYVTLSLGIASLIPSSSLNPKILIAEADQALYTAKNRGRNQVFAAEQATSI